MADYVLKDDQNRDKGYVLRQFGFIRPGGLLALFLREWTRVKAFAFFVVPAVLFPVLYVWLLKLIIFSNQDSVSQDFEGYLPQLMPGLLFFATIMSCFGVIGGAVMIDKMYHSFDDILLAPVKVGELIISRVLFGLSYCTMMACFTWPLLSYAGDMPFIPANPPMVVVTFVFLVVPMILLMFLIGCICKRWDQFSFFQTLIFMPLFVASGAVSPLSALPKPLQEIMFYNPLAHVFEGLRGYWFVGSYEHSTIYLWFFPVFSALLFAVIRGILLARLGVRI